MDIMTHLLLARSSEVPERIGQRVFDNMKGNTEEMLLLAVAVVKDQRQCVNGSSDLYAFRLNPPPRAG
jgi:hypothetical protein